MLAQSEMAVPKALGGRPQLNQLKVRLGGSYRLPQGVGLGFKGTEPLLCPDNASGSLDVDLLRNRQGVVDFDSKISRRAFDLAMPQEKLHGSEIAGATVNQSRFGSAK